MVAMEPLLEQRLHRRGRQVAPADEPLVIGVNRHRCRGRPGRHGTSAAASCDDQTVTGSSVGMATLNDRGRDRPSSFRVSGGPPRRSQRALLAHWAPALGSGGESVVGPGVQDAGSGYPSIYQAAHACPVQARALAAAP
jgi:hypothetical protein